MDGNPLTIQGGRFRFLAGFQVTQQIPVRGFLGGSDSRGLFFRLNISQDVLKIAQLHSRFPLTPIDREGTTLV